MFKKNERYQQSRIFDICNTLSKKQQKLWEKSKEHFFFNEVFCKIDEELFSVLYSEKLSRPNVPVNQLVGSLILKHLYNWTYEQMFQQLNFNILTRHAIGINNLDENIFCEASIFNFQNKLIEHREQTGEDLIDKVFCHLTERQIKELNVDTKIQRGDSFLVGSNIVDYTRLRLLVEILIRLNRDLILEDDKKFKSALKDYVSCSSDKYVYQVNRKDLAEEYQKIGALYYQLDISLGDNYKNKKSYQDFKRVLKDHFDIQAKKQSTIIKLKKQPTTNSLQSPDDSDATFHRKGSETSKGYTTHISETVNPENDINLITDVVVELNNKGDEKILKDRLPIMVDRTPELDEYFVDGLYGSPDIDVITEKEKIKIYQSNQRGQKSKAGVEIFEKDSEVWVSCKGDQEVKAEPTRRGERMRAIFDSTICSQCPFSKECNIKYSGGKTKLKRRIFYFAKEKILVHKRSANMKELAGDKKRFSRANVEATVKEVKRGMKNKKVRVRGLKRVSLHMIFTVIAINATRIWSKTSLLKYFQSLILCSVSQCSYKIYCHKIPKNYFSIFFIDPKGFLEWTHQWKEMKIRLIRQSQTNESNQSAK